jgi:hypothetical protein
MYVCMIHNILVLYVRSKEVIKSHCNSIILASSLTLLCTTTIAPLFSSLLCYTYMYIYIYVHVGCWSHLSNSMYTCVHNIYSNIHTHMYHILRRTCKDRVKRQHHLTENVMPPSLSCRLFFFTFVFSCNCLRRQPIYNLFVGADSSPCVHVHWHVCI